MTTFFHSLHPVIAVGLLLSASAATATAKDNPLTIQPGEVFSVNLGETMRINPIYGDDGTGPYDPAGHLENGGTLENYGTILNEGDIQNGVIKNYGTFLQQHTLTTPTKVINYAAGTMVVSGYFETKEIENFGRFLFLTPRGGEPGGNQYVNTILKNHGHMLVDYSGSLTRVNGKVENDGVFEIGSEAYPKNHGDTNQPFRYKQTGGETIVNGTLDGEITFTGGILSGTGTVGGLLFGMTNDQLPPKVNLSPGAPFGTLTLAPTASYLACVGCSLDIEIGSPTESDRLQVSGQFHLRNSPKINVLLRKGWNPPANSAFTIVSADSLQVSPPMPVYNLPQLPGRTWQIETTATSIILRVN